MARCLVDSGVECDVQEYTANLYAQSNLPIIVLVIEHLFKVLIFEMLEILLGKRGDDEIGSWTGENTQAIPVTLKDVYSKDDRNLYGVCTQVIYRVVRREILTGCGVLVVEIKTVVRDAECHFRLQVEPPF